jgi:hypothetical protein
LCCECLLEVELPLAHKYLECAQLVFSEVDSGLGHVCIDYLAEQGYVSLGVHAYSVYEVGVPRSVEVLLHVCELDVDDCLLLVGHSLQLDEVLMLAVNGVLLQGGVRVGGEELSAFSYKIIF